MNPTIEAPPQRKLAARVSRAATVVRDAAQNVASALWWTLAVVLLVAAVLLVFRLVSRRRLEIEVWDVSPKAQDAGIDPRQMTRMFADALAADVLSAADRLRSGSQASSGSQPSFTLSQDDLPQDIEIKPAGFSIREVASNVRWLIGLQPVQIHAAATVRGSAVTVTVHAGDRVSTPVTAELPKAGDSDTGSFLQTLAREAAKQALTMFAPHSAAALYFDGGQYQLAEEVLIQIAAGERGTDKAQALNMLGVIALAARRFDEAELRFRDALSVDARYVNAYANLGLLSESRGEPPEKVERLYRDALARDPQNVPALVQLGHFLIAQKRNDEGLKALRLAARLAPPGGAAAMAYANIAKGSSALDEADRAYEAAAENAPTNESIRFAWGTRYLDSANASCVDLGRCLSLLRSAEAHLRQAIGLSPCHADAHRALGETLFRAANRIQHERGSADPVAVRVLANAELEYRKAIELSPASDEARAGLDATVQSEGRSLADNDPSLAQLRARCAVASP